MGQNCPVCGRENGGAWSRDYILRFLGNGNKWLVESTVAHLVEVHGWQPYKPFVNDVMKDKLILTPDPQRKVPTRVMPRNMDAIRPIGKVPKGFLEKLKELMEQAAPNGSSW